MYLTLFFFHQIFNCQRAEMRLNNRVRGLKVEALFQGHYNDINHVAQSTGNDKQRQKCQDYCKVFGRDGGQNVSWIVSHVGYVVVPDFGVSFECCINVVTRVPDFSRAGMHFCNIKI